MPYFIASVPESHFCVLSYYQPQIFWQNQGHQHRNVSSDWGFSNCCISINIKDNLAKFGFHTLFIVLYSFMCNCFWGNTENFIFDPKCKPSDTPDCDWHVCIRRTYAGESLSCARHTPRALRAPSNFEHAQKNRRGIAEHTRSVRGRSTVGTPLAPSKRRMYAAHTPVIAIPTP